MISRLKRLRIAFIIAFALALAALLALAIYLYLLRVSGEGTSGERQTRASFIETCKRQGRFANGGGEMRMDDATEESLDRYCSCVADHFDLALSPTEINAVGAGTASQETLVKLNAVVATCQAEHLMPAKGQTVPAN